MGTDHCMQRSTYVHRNGNATRSSSRDETANVNFFDDDIVHMIDPSRSLIKSVDL